MKQTLSNVADADAALSRRWLGWRYPHYDRMAEDAAKTLAGDATAVVRVGFDASTLSPSSAAGCHLLGCSGQDSGEVLAPDDA